MFCHFFFPCSDCFGFGKTVFVQVSGTGCQFVVEAVDIIVQHTFHRIVGSDFRHRVLDILYPFRRVSLAVSCIISRDDLCFQCMVDSSGIQLVLILLVFVSTFVGQCPTCTRFVTFVPPSVQYGEVQDTVHLSFFTRRTGCFQRTGRSVQPNIDTCDQVTGQTHIVVFQEDDLS